MFSRDIKRLSFRCQTFKFSRPTVKSYFLTLLKRKMILINKKRRNYQKSVPLSMICEIKWKNLCRIIPSQKLFQKSLRTTLHVWAGKLQSSVTPETQTFDVHCTWLSFARKDEGNLIVGSVKGCKVYIWAKWPTRKKLMPISVAWSDWEYSYPSPPPSVDGMLVYRRVTSSIKFVGTHLYTWVERGTQEHNIMSSVRAWTQTVWSGDERTNRNATAPGRPSENTHNSWLHFIRTLHSVLTKQIIEIYSFEGCSI